MEGRGGCRPNVSIQFSNKKYQGATRPFRLTGFSKDSLLELVNEANERMGSHDGIKEFSDGILGVEISGPEMDPLTSADLPGLYQGSTAEQSQRGVKFVNNLIDRYISQKNSIILAVVWANHNLADQKFLVETKKHDPKRERTFRVVMEPDLAGLLTSGTSYSLLRIKRPPISSPSAGMSLETGERRIKSKDSRTRNEIARRHDFPDGPLVFQCLP